MAESGSRIRRYLLLLVLLGGFGLVLFRLVTLQVLQAEELSAKADHQHQKTVSLEGPRGTIVDRHGKVLAMNMEVPSVFGIPATLKSPSKTAQQLATVLPVKTAEIEKKLLQDRKFVWLARKMDPEQGRRLDRLSLDGIGVVMEGRRFYPKGPLLSHVLGFAGMDGDGLEGIEHRYEAYLRGEKRMVALQLDALGRTVFPKSLAETGPAAGHQLTLTIDEVVQFIAERELDEAVTRSRAKSGTIIILDPPTGAVLAMAVSPRFDPNALSAVNKQTRLQNTAITDAYEPGSTMKAMIAAAAIEDGVMKPTSMLFGEHGRMTIANTVIHDHEKLGWVSFAQAIQKSSNIGAAKAGMALGEQRLYRYLHAFGFGQRTDIDLPGEGVGLVKNPKSWGGRSVASISMGQEIGVTPIQMVSAVAALANGGVLMKPYVVSEVRDAEGHLLKRVPPQMKRRVISLDTAHSVTKILEGVVTQGTGARAAIPGFRVAGKTGTAQQIDPQTHRYSSSRFVASFAGYVPADRPRLAMIVIIDAPQDMQASGGSAAAPVFSTVGEQVLSYLGVSSDEPITLAMALPHS